MSKLTYTKLPRSSQKLAPASESGPDLGKSWRRLDSDTICSSSQMPGPLLVQVSRAVLLLLSFLAMYRRWLVPIFNWRKSDQSKGFHFYTLHADGQLPL
jgi:hypothetical protein